MKPDLSNLSAGFNLFKRPSAAMLARQELEEAQRQLLVAQSGLDYARRMVEYHTDRVKRLTHYLKTVHTEENQ